MKIRYRWQQGMTLVEITVTAGLVGVLGLTIFALLNMGTILGAKNTAMNTAHQQARIAMLKIVDDLHSAISLPVVLNQGAGISFQQWVSGPHKIKNDAATGQKVIRIVVTTGQSAPVVGQRLVVPTHQIEDDITAVSGNNSDLSITLATNLSVPIQGTGSTGGDITCYVTTRTSYDVVQTNNGSPPQYTLRWTPMWPGFPDATKKVGTRDIVTDVTNPAPFSIPPTEAGALYYRFVAAVDLSTSDAHYSNRGFKAANILLSGQVPYKARLTTYQ